MILHNLHHSRLDIWVVRREDITGFQMLTDRAKRWALDYKAMDDPEMVHGMLWVANQHAAGILIDLERSGLDVLLDNMKEGQIDA